MNEEKERELEEEEETKEQGNEEKERERGEEEEKRRWKESTRQAKTNVCAPSVRRCLPQPSAEAEKKSSDLMWLLSSFNSFHFFFVVSCSRSGSKVEQRQGREQL